MIVYFMHCIMQYFLGVGDFSIWEFSGNPVYYCSYDYFAANDTTAIHLVLFSLEEPYETQLNQVTFWLNCLKALTLPEDNIGMCNCVSVSWGYSVQCMDLFSSFVEDFPLQ